MKKLKLKFDGMEGMLNKQQMKSIKGGYSSSSGGDLCSVSVECDDEAVISCSGKKCHYARPNIFSIGWVKCDSDDKIYCNIPDW